MWKLVVLVVLVFVLGSGCSGDEPDVVMPQWAADLMQRLPGDVQFTVLDDISALRADPALRSEYDNLASWFELAPWPIIVPFDRLEYWAGSDRVRLLVGGVELAEARKTLSDEGWTTDEHLGFETWKTEEQNGDAVALDSGFAIVGTEASVKEAIRTLRGERASLYDNGQVLGLMAKLPSGFRIIYQEVEWDSESDSSGIVLVGSAVGKADDDNVRLTSAATSLSSDIAEDYIQEVAKSFEQEEYIGPSDISVTHDGGYVKLAVEIPVSALSRPPGW